MVEVVKGMKFGKEPVALDGRMFYECRFDGSNLIYSGGEMPSFEKCHFIRTRFNFQGAAGNTLKFMTGLYHGGFRTSIEQTFEDMKNLRPDPEKSGNNTGD